MQTYTLIQLQVFVAMASRVDGTEDVRMANLMRAAFGADNKDFELMCNSVAGE